MYNNLLKTRRGRPWLLLAALFSWLLPQTAAAEQFIHDPDNYSVSLGGSNIVYFTAPIYDQKNADQWVENGQLQVSVDGAAPKSIFMWYAAEMGLVGIDGDATEVPTMFNARSDGFFDITLGNTNSTIRLTKGNYNRANVKRNNDGYSYTFEAEWVVPYNLLGKKLTFSWVVTRNGNINAWESTRVTGLKTVTINMPEASAKLTPFVSSPMMDPNTPGKLQVPWFLLSDSITNAYYEYRDAADKYFKEDIENMNSGIIVLDANVPHKNLRVVCDYKEQGDKGSYLIEGVGSSPHNVPFIHGPVGLTARPLDERTPKVELTWNVPYPDDEDLTPTDFFEIQRSLTGKEEDFRTISSSVFYAYNDKKTLYTYVDSTLLEAIQTSMLTGGGTLDHLTYRVRRAITQNWGWGADNCCATTASCVMDNLHLLRIKDYSAQWEDSLSYTARVSWQYADEHGAVWDDRAKMMLRVTMKNREGDIVDSLVYTLTDDERAQRYKIVNLTHSCVNYDIEMYVDRDTSPINQLADVTEFYYPIRDELGWIAFNQKVQNAEGKYDVNARLYADISTPNSCGDDSHPYRGVFDGNGHTITVNYNGSENNLYNNRFVAPFRYVGNATIKNLHTAGTITTSNMNAAGLIANVLEGSSVAIENCRSSVVINSSYDGATENGGFISRQSGATVVIKNSKFDGAFEGDNSSENGGFVGWVARGSKLSIDYSLFAPDHLSTKADKCDTWAVLDSLNVTYTLTNSHASREFTATVMIGNAADWHKFAVMVNEAVNQYDVNAILTADITTSEHVGVTEGAVFRGTFDGNGHTLTFNKDWTENERFIAPFRHASNATIKNLHVAGTIKSGQKYPAGIIAQVINGTTTIENCRSSVTLNSTITGESTLAGGLVGRVSNSKVTIRNSKFDGSFEGDKSIGNGGFIAWVDEKSSATIIDCLFMPASVKTDPELSETWARQDEKGTVSIANCYATEEFCRIINDANDWEAFRTALSNRGSKSVNAILNANFSIDHSAVNFKGTFDGNRYTLNLNGTDGTFLSAEDYTIKNLHVTGSMGGDQHVAGLVGSSFRGNIQSCWVSVGIHCNTTHAGGFIGHAHDTQHTINNCLFDGSVSAKNDGKNDGTSYAGAFIGWAGGADNHVTNCLEDGNYYYVDHAGFCYKGNGDAWGNTGNSKNNYTYKGVSWNEVNYDGIRHNNISYVVKELGDGWYAEGDDALPKMTRRDLWYNVGSLSANDLASKLGNGWYVEDGKVLPVMALGTAGVSEEELARYYGNGWTKEINMVAWNDAKPKYDIRDWNPDHQVMSRGITLHSKEMAEICALLRGRPDLAAENATGAQQRPAAPAFTPAAAAAI